MNDCKAYQTKRKYVINTRALNSPLTGVQRYILELLKRFENKFQCRITKLSPAKQSSGIWGHFWEQVVLPQYLKNHVLFSPSNTGPLAIRRQVVTIHDLVPLDHPEWLNPQFAAWYRLLIPLLVQRVDKIITISNFTRERLLEWTKVNPQKIVVIYNGVDDRFHPRSEQEILKAIKTLNIPTKHYVLSLGSLEPRKNLHRLLQAWGQIYKEIPQEIWLVIAGAKGKSLVFKNISFDKLPPRVHFTGHVEDKYLPALYSGAYSGALAFAYMSVYEGFGLPPLEAMASGTPPLTGNLTALPEVIGDAGLMVNPFDIEAIAWGLKSLIEDSQLRAQLRKKGLDRAKQFSWDKTAELTWKVIQNAAQES